MTSAAAMLARMNRPRVWSTARPCRRAKVPSTAALARLSEAGADRAARRTSEANSSAVEDAPTSADASAELLLRPAANGADAAAMPRKRTNERRVWTMAGISFRYRHDTRSAPPFHFASS
jgi:hypothetical protein